MIRERTLLNLAIGLFFSLLLHVYVVVWGLPLSLPTAVPQESREIEVQLREWPGTPPAVQPPAEQTNVARLPAAEPVKVPRDKPLVPPNAEALQETLQAATADVRLDQKAVQLPPGPPPVKSLEASADPVRIAQSLLDSLQRGPRIADPAFSPPPPEPGRMLADRKELPPLPGLERRPRREVALTKPGALPFAVQRYAPHIQGPAAERQVIFQPPPPNATVESETEIELRFWILPNGAVSRVIPITKSDPRLEAVAITYLRTWRFNPLPPDAKPVEQWGVIPFKFVIR
ncbi:MAG: TonB family protein [Nitrospinae bacterium]|nr:TonB family protein [Nitrospinota bacterium]